MKSILTLFSLILAWCAWGQQRPYINSIDPQSAGVNEIVTIVGSGFNPGNMQVNFGAVQATIIDESTNQIQVQVPVAATHDKISVYDLSSGNMASSANYFFPSWGSTTLPSTYPFADALATATGEAEVWDLCMCDFDGDGKSDVAMTSAFINASSRRQVYRNTSSGGSISLTLDFEAGSQGAQSINCMDLDGDGKPDLVAAQRTTTGEKNIELYRNTSSSGSINFATAIELVPPQDPSNNIRQPWRIEIADIDLDGRPDLIVSFSSFTWVDIYLNTGSPGSLSFASPIHVDVPNEQGIRGLRVGDLNQDDLPDIVVVPNEENEVFVFRNQSLAGTPRFTQDISLSISSYTFKNVEIADFDADGKNDIAITHFNLSSPTGRVIILANETPTPTGLIALADEVNFAVSTLPYGLSAADINGDGKVDLATASLTSSNSVTALFNTSTETGDINFDVQAGLTTTFNSRSIRAGDLNGDAKPDFVFTYNSAIATEGSLGTIVNEGCLVPELSPATGSFCDGISFIVSTSSGFDNTYDWEVDAGSGFTIVKSGAESFLDLGSLGLSGDVTVKVTATSGDGGCTEVSQNFTYSYETNGSGTTTIVSDKDSFCGGETLTLTSELTGSNLTYMWTGPGDFSSTDESVEITDIDAVNAGTYGLIIQEAGRCPSAQVTKNIEVITVPKANIINSDDDIFCDGGEATLSITQFDGFAYQWNQNGAAISGQTGDSYVATETGDYNLTVQEINSGCEIDGAIYAIREVAAPTSSITAIDAICVDLPVAFDATVTSSESDLTVGFLWDWRNESDISQGTSEDQNTSFSFSAAGTYSARLTTRYVDVANCASDASHSLVVEAIPDIEIQAPEGTEKCRIDSLLLEVEEGFTSYIWSTGSTTNSTYGKTDVSDPAMVTLDWVTNVGCIGTSTITIQNYANSGFIVTSNANDIVDGVLQVPDDFDLTLEMTASSGTNFTWSPAEIFDDPSLATVQVFPKRAETDILLTGIDANNCPEELSFRLLNPNVQAQRSFSPNGDGLNDCWLIFNTSDQEGCTLYVYDKRGRIVYQADSPFAEDCAWEGVDSSGKEMPADIYYFVFKCDDKLISQSGSILLAR